MKTLEERLSAVEFDLSQFKTETISAYLNRFLCQILWSGKQILS